MKEMIKKRGWVETRHWGPDDDYLVVEIQVFAEDGFKEGDIVEVTIENIEKKGGAKQKREE